MKTQTRLEHCTYNKGAISPCKDLEQSINAINYPQGALGIHLIQLLKDGKHDKDVFGMKIHSGEHVGMRFCPFCGKPIRSL